MAVLRSVLRFFLGGTPTPTLPPKRFVDGLIQFAGKATWDKSYFETNFREFARAMGGTYYSSGSAVTQGRGALNAQNFKSAAGITNDYKAEPFAIFAYQVHIPSLALFLGEVEFQCAVEEDAYLRTGQFIYRMSNVSATDGTLFDVTTAVYVNGTIASQGYRNVARLGHLAVMDAASFSQSAAVPGFHVKQGDVISVHVNLRTGDGGPGTSIKDGVFTLWAKAKHVE